MTLTAADNTAMALRVQLEPEERETIDRALDEYLHIAHENGVRLDTCDGIAAVEAAMIRHTLDSRRLRR